MNRKIIGFLFLSMVLLVSPMSQAMALGEPNTNFATGDTFLFDQYRETEHISDMENEISNPENESMIYRYDADWRNRTELMEGEAKIGIIKSSDNIPFSMLQEGGEVFDHILTADSWMEMLPGSVEEWERTTWDMGANDGQGEWYNDSGSHDMSGETFHNDKDGDNIMPVQSNTTYLILFPEMFMDSIYVDWGWQMGLPFNLDMPYDFEVPLINRNVYTDSWDYDVNGATQTFNVREVDNSFYYYNTSTSSTLVPFGDCHDCPETPWVELNVSWTIEIDFFSAYIFDQDNGMLLDMYEERYISFDIHIFGYNVSVVQPEMFTLNQEGGGPAYMDVDMWISQSSDETTGTTIAEASSFYGNTRPTSVANNRGFEEGDGLFYYMEQDNYFYMDRETNGYRGDQTKDEYEWMSSEREVDGSVIFDIYRTQAGSMDAVMFFWGEGMRYEDYEFERYENDVLVNENSWYEEWETDDGMLQLIQFLTTNDLDIMYFFDESRYIDAFNRFYEDNRDGGDGDNFNFPFWDYSEITANQSMEMFQELMVFEGDDIFYINDVEITWMNITAYEQLYELSVTETIQVSVGWDGNGNEIFVPVDVDVYAEAWQTWYYDTNTGAMVAMDQGHWFDIYIDVSMQWQEWDDGLGQNVDAGESTSVNIWGSDSWFMLLEEHPSLYTEALGPVPTTTETTETNDTTSEEPTTTTEETTTTEDNDTGPETPQLPIPISLGPVVFSLSVIAIYARRRK
ncbi:MAG: hypothetical protein INQ03_24185 [Candidatus Heimdallarchaeota archaeon]|nr:hypothetical protein [Candidatus Heimdallarchaeota archaeon]